MEKKTKDKSSNIKLFEILSIRFNFEVFDYHCFVKMLNPNTNNMHFDLMSYNFL